MEKQKLEVVRPFGDAEIEAHAAKVGGKRNLREVIVETDDGYAFHYLVKKPSRAIVQAIDFEGQKNVPDINRTHKLMIGTVLEGDKDAYEYDGSIYIRLIQEIGDLIEQSKADVKKL